MIENKRFIITQDFEEHHRQIRDNGHIIMGCFIEPQAEVIVDLLNELNDENMELKKENARLKQQLTHCRKLLNDDLDIALEFIKHKGYSLQDLKDYEKAMQND